MPTNHWHDLLHHAHDRAFVVAGATRDALLEDFQSAIDDAIAKGLPFKGWLDKDDTYHPGFLDRFDEIVKRHGWDYKGGREWRARVIYETNLKSVYAAGHYSQLTDPDVLKVYPFWEYVHGLNRVPNDPREEHQGWDGLILRADDPWWQTYYPPNGWKCGCGVRPVSKAKLKRLGKEGPDPSPKIETERRADPATGDLLDYPKGTDMGWAYAPGRTWADGLVPRELQAAPDKQMELPGITNLPAMVTNRPLSTPELGKDLPAESYVKAFLDEFAAAPDDPSLFRDKAGHAVLISEDLFRRPDGTSKLFNARGQPVTARVSGLLHLAEAVKDPDEIWVDWEWHEGRKAWILKRRYLRTAPNLAGVIVFEWSRFGWRGTSAYNATKGRSKKLNYTNVEAWRRGALLFRRQEEDPET
ncbi:hypothetical protein J7481_19585 [Labrenzia sp. R4_2]|uniref:PBECR2 nuclease fold domain-containing protein n=1 Tax=Labrenzia sp. R4_2 TaxID=2821107 RepID=UPI001ADC1DCB|nr:PBECR2 nuclease fold domain-containing protein [Labrenzia sp. R4_2]MBO9421719.1 hypothetical protein [Labrenzia sp. R4_2]